MYYQLAGETWLYKKKKKTDQNQIIVINLILATLASFAN